MGHLGLLRRLLAVVAVIGVGFVSLAAGPASATGGKTIEYVVHVPGMLADNLCNADAAVLNGDLYVRETTTPARNGGYYVQSTINGRGLTGHGLPSDLDYRGDDRENSFAYYAPPPYPGYFYDAHYTKLVPVGNAPSMYLVIVLREVVMADGTVVPTISQLYLVCRQPTQSCHRA